MFIMDNLKPDFLGGILPSLFKKQVSWPHHASVSSSAKTEIIEVNTS